MSNNQNKEKKIIIKHDHSGGEYPKVRLENIDGELVARSSISVDLSGSAQTLVVFHSELRNVIIKSAYLLYTEASSADSGITIEIGKESDRDYFYTGTSEVSKSQWYSKTITLLKNDLSAGDTLTFYNAGGKSGTGEIMLIIEYKFV